MKGWLKLFNQGAGTWLLL